MTVLINATNQFHLRSTDKVHHMGMPRSMMGQRTAAKMRVDTHISRCSAQTLPFAVRDMLFRLGITILLRHPEVYHMYEIRVLRSRPTDEEIVWFDISVN